MDERRNANGTFKPGICGNKNGRPKKESTWQRSPEAVRQVFFKVGEERVSVAGPDGPIEMSRLEAAVRAIYRDANKGRPGAQRLVMTNARELAEIHSKMNELTRYFGTEMMKLQAENDELRAKLPKAQTHGVLTLEPSPTQFPSLYVEPPNSDDAET